jgi:hypothetical protein
MHSQWNGNSENQAFYVPIFKNQQVVRKRGKGQGLKHLQHLAQLLHEEEKDSRPNPVTQNVKIIMVSSVFVNRNLYLYKLK